MRSLKYSIISLIMQRVNVDAGRLIKLNKTFSRYANRAGYSACVQSRN